MRQVGQAPHIGEIGHRSGWRRSYIVCLMCKARGPYHYSLERAEEAWNDRR
jgi:hypothetical protein